MQYLVLIEKGENSFGAYTPDVPGCVAVGETLEEVLILFQKALEFHFEGMAQEGEAIPTPAYIEARFVEVEVPQTMTSAS